MINENYFDYHVKFVLTDYDEVSGRIPQGQIDIMYKTWTFGRGLMLADEILMNGEIVSFWVRVEDIKMIFFRRVKNGQVDDHLDQD